VSSDFVTVASMTVASMTVSSMTPDDLDEIMPLERRCFADPWTRRMYLNDLTTNEAATYLVVRHGDAGTRRNGEGQTVEDYFAVSPCHGVPVSPCPRVAASPILAYGGFWLLLDEAHIATVASHPDWRGCGLGEWLMLALLDTAVLRGAVTSTLEVRAGNLPAKRLYEKLGYEVAGVRKRYYRDGEDGLIMTTPPLAGPVMQTRLAGARQDALHRLEHCFDE
jgi:[ribosomal protein S18]-alanine N-acetyltransferase